MVPDPPPPSRPLPLPPKEERKPATPPISSAQHSQHHRPAHHSQHHQQPPQQPPRNSQVFKQPARKPEVQSLPPITHWLLFTAVFSSRNWTPLPLTWTNWDWTLHQEVAQRTRLIRHLVLTAKLLFPNRFKFQHGLLWWPSLPPQLSTAIPITKKNPWTRVVFVTMALYRRAILQNLCEQNFMLFQCFVHFHPLIGYLYTYSIFEQTERYGPVSRFCSPWR